MSRTHDKRLIAFLKWVLGRPNPVAFGDAIREAAVNPSYLRECSEFARTHPNFIKAGG